MLIPFNKPFVGEKELEYVRQVLNSGKISGDGIFTHKCHQFFTEKYGFKKVLLTNSCTDALEMTAILLDIQTGDEVIIPSYTFVSVANAYILRGAKVVFADSEARTPNIDTSQLESLINAKTKAIVTVHYGGIACNMDAIQNIAKKYNLFIVEDAAQSIDSFYLPREINDSNDNNIFVSSNISLGEGKPLGSIGTFGTFSFHETKNITSGEGGLLAINDGRFFKRAEIIREKGTNRSAFFRGEVDKYNWVDIGSSYLPSDIVAAVLYAQMERLKEIQEKRIEIWNAYYERLKDLELSGKIKLPFIPDYATNNGHVFYLITKNLNERTELISFLKGKGIQAVFHYLSLHKSPFFSDKHDGRVLPNADKYSDCLVRLPLYYELTFDKIDKISELIHKFYK